jgi:hypothetical protein
MARCENCGTRVLPITNEQIDSVICGARGESVRYEGGRVSPPWKVTARGEIVLATFGTLVLLAMLGIAGWVEGGMQ